MSLRTQLSTFRSYTSPLWLLADGPVSLCDRVCGYYFPYLVAPDEKSEKLSKSSEKLSQQNVLLISLASAFPYCGLGRGVVGSEEFSRFPSRP